MSLSSVVLAYESGFYEDITDLSRTMSEVLDGYHQRLIREFAEFANQSIVDAVERAVSRDNEVRHQCDANPGQPGATFVAPRVAPLEGPLMAGGC